MKGVKKWVTRLITMLAEEKMGLMAGITSHMSANVADLTKYR